MPNCRPQFFIPPGGSSIFLQRPHRQAVTVCVVMAASLLSLTDAVKSSMGMCIAGVCFNGGTPKDSGACMCPVKFRGTCCENTEADSDTSFVAFSSGRSVGKVPTCDQCFNGGTRYFSNIHAVHKCLCPPYHYGTCCEVQEGSSNPHAQMYLWVSVAASGIVLLLACLCILCICKRLD